MNYTLTRRLSTLPFRPFLSKQQARHATALPQVQRDEDLHILQPLPAVVPEQGPLDVVVSVLGSDRVGIIRAFSNVLTASCAHVAQSRMSLLGGDFAMIVHVKLPSLLADPRTLERRIRAELPGFSVLVRETVPRVGEGTGLEMWRVRLQARDQVGIVSAFANVVERWGGNVLQMETETVHGKFNLKGCLNVQGAEGLAVALKEVEEKFNANIALELLSVGGIQR